MIPWEKLARASADDGTVLELRRRGSEYLILAGGHDLMSSEDEGSSRALGELGCAHLAPDRAARVLVGGLGMGYTLRAALNRVSGDSVVEVAELVPAVVEWNRTFLEPLADAPLTDARSELHVGDVRDRIAATAGAYDAILLDVDNGPDALAHDANDALYSDRGLAGAFRALRPGGMLGVWSFSDDRAFTRRLEQRRFQVRVEKVRGSTKGRGRHHFIWLARRPS